MAREHSIAFPYAERFGAVQAALPGGDLSWLAGLRTEAIARVRDSGLPTQRVEAWKYTSLNDLAKTEFAAADAGSTEVPASAERDSLLPWDAPAHRMVFVNGRFRAELSDLGAFPANAILRPLADAVTSDGAVVQQHLGDIAPVNGNAMVSLNTAFWSDGVLLSLPAGLRLERPVHLIFVGSAADAPVAFHPRILVVAGENSTATLLESHVGSGRYWSNPVTEIAIGQNAELHHVKLQAEAREATHLAYLKARLARGSRYDNFALSVGARVARNEVTVTLDGEGAEAGLFGGYLAGHGQHLDTTTLIDHAKPHGTSRELYKGALDGKARAVFQGKIAVRKDAQKTDAHMLNKTLLLSTEAEIDTKPELEIYADDVKCGHGATAGEIEEDALFYLRARGIGEDQARRMLIEAFLKEIVEGVSFAPAHDRLERLVSDWLAAH